MKLELARKLLRLAAWSSVVVCAEPALADLGRSYCPAALNSTGGAARVVAVGSVDVALDRLELRCEGLPAGAVGVFLFGRDAAFLPGHAGTSGTLCIAPPFARDPLGALQATAGGRVQRALALSSVPLPGGATAVAPGETLRVQFWYRDVTPQGASGNSSDGYRLTFSGSFPDAAEVLIAAGDRPALEIADMDRDGLLDIVSVGLDGRLVVHRSLGGRNFEERALVELGEVTRGVALGDFDGDGAIDVATCLSESGAIALFQNDGAGALQRRSDITGLPRASVVRSSDIDADGLLDLVVVSDGSSTARREVRSLRNLGGLQFAAVGSYSVQVGVGPTCLMLGDLDGDQDADALFTTPSALVPSATVTAVLSNDGLGGWTVRPGPQVTSQVQSVDLVDIDGDGALDVLFRVVTNAGFGSIDATELFSGDGAGGFALTPVIYSLPLLAPARDIDGDGDFDALVSAWPKPTVVLENLGGALQPARRNAFVRATGEGRIADLDGDGRPELVVPKPSRNALGIRALGPLLEIAGDEHIFLSPQPIGISAGDLDGDGDTDVVSFGLGATLLENRGGSLEARAEVVWLGANLQQVLVLDVDGDQRADLVALQRESTGQTAIGVRRALGGFAYAALVPSPGPRWITRAAHGDLDGDGRDDLVLASDAGLSVALNDGAGGFGVPSPIGGGQLIRDVVLVDLDRDGALDIAATETDVASIAIFRGDGSGSFQAPASLPVGASPSGLASGDWNGDGWPDLVVRNGGEGTLVVLLNTGTGTLVPGATLPAPLATDRIGVGDLDGDGLVDLAVPTGMDEAIVVLAGHGDGTFTRRRAFALLQPARMTLPLDLDLDGALELVVLASQVGGTVTVLR